MASDLSAIPRTTCACELCKAPCRTMPGSLGPGDVEAITEHCGVREGDVLPWFFRHFAASEGALVMKQGMLFRIPTIVPQQRSNGHCVFLRPDGTCSVHPVAPFGCSRHDMHMDSKEGSRRSSAMLQAVLEDEEYRKRWSLLHAAGAIPRGGSLSDRRAAMAKEVQSVEEAMRKEADNADE